MNLSGVTKRASAYATKLRRVRRCDWLGHF